MKIKLFENYGEDSNKMAALLGIGVIIVVGVFLWILTLIWTPKKVNGTNNAENEKVEEISKVNLDSIGSYIEERNGTTRMLKEYFSDIFFTLSSGTKEEVFKMVSEDYLSKNKLSVSSLYTKLSNKGLIGKAFQSNKYSLAENPRFGRIYSLEISSIDSSTLDRIIIIEKSPRNYKLSFDSYIGKSKQNVSKINNGVKLEITEVEEYRDKVYFKVSVQNLQEKNIILNYEKKANEAIYCNVNKDTKIYNSAEFFSGKEIVLKPQEKISAKVEFFISDLQSANINKFVLVNVHSLEDDSTSSLEYEVYKK